MLRELALLLIVTVADACPRVRSTHYLLPTTSNGFGNQYYAIEKALDEHFGFDKVPDALSKSLTARSGGKLVIDVASPAPSETCCVVA